MIFKIYDFSLNLMEYFLLYEYFFFFFKKAIRIAKRMKIQRIFANNSKDICN